MDRKHGFFKDDLDWAKAVEYTKGRLADVGGTLAGYADELEDICVGKINPADHDGEFEQRLMKWRSLASLMEDALDKIKDSLEDFGDTQWSAMAAQTRLRQIEKGFV